MIEVTAPIEKEGSLLKIEHIKIEASELTNNKMKLNWKIYENQNPTFEDFYDMSGRAFETDIADKYIHAQGISPKYDIKGHVYAVLPIFSELNGKPWNNLALDVICSLSPSFIRVIKPNYGGQTCDALTNRVTVYLREDNRTIDHISFEAQCASIGVRDGMDLKAKMSGVDLVKLKESGHTPGVYVNSAAIAKINIDF